MKKFLAALTLAMVGAVISVVPAHAATPEFKNSVKSEHQIRLYYRASNCTGDSVALPPGYTWTGLRPLSIRSSVADFRLEEMDGTNISSASAGGCLVNPHTHDHKSVVS